jgi:NADH-quinone oxidoreductase subunit L
MTLGALLSALYIGRLVFLTFFGAPRSEEAEHAHESPPIMTGPLVVLALGAAGVGLVIERTTDGGLTRWVQAVLGSPPEGQFGLPLAALTTIAALGAIAMLVIAWLVYASGRVDWMALRVRLAPIQRLFANGWYIDEYYSTILVAPGKAAAAFSAYRFDRGFIDGIVNGIGGGTRRLAGWGRRIQTGYVRTYALVLFAGAVAVLAYAGLRS